MKPTVTMVQWTTWNSREETDPSRTSSAFDLAGSPSLSLKALATETLYGGVSVNAARLQLLQPVISRALTRSHVGVCKQSARQSDRGSMDLRFVGMSPVNLTSGGASRIAAPIRQTKPTHFTGGVESGCAKDGRSPLRRSSATSVGPFLKGCRSIASTSMATTSLEMFGWLHRSNKHAISVQLSDTMVSRSQSGRSGLGFRPRLSMRGFGSSAGAHRTQYRFQSVSGARNQTADTTLLNLELSGAVSVDGSLTYIEAE